MKRIEVFLHLRDERLLLWLQDQDEQKIPARDIARYMNCHEQTARAMLNRLESAGWIKLIRSTRGGHKIVLLRKFEQ